MKKSFALLVMSGLLASAGAGIAPIASAQSYDAAQWSGLRYRHVGPWRGGRVTTVTGVPAQPRTFYMGTVGGGVWKTTDAGHKWINTTDGQIKVGSIGAVAVSESNPDVVYAGTGSSKIRSNVSIGKGVYKSVDGAKTWVFMGLRDVGQIAAVRINPSNPDEVFVAAGGDPFKYTKERGVYRTRDGGKTWKKILFLNERLGAADIEFQADNRAILYATMWHGLRQPWSIISGGTEGGVYKSLDGGETWAKLGGGLPTGLFGRANIGVTASAPNTLYALIEAKPGQGLYRSDDAGTSWTLVNGEAKLVTRPFYYTTLGVDPTNANVVFVGNEGWFKSVDGGKSFKTRPVPHGDNHDVWMNPRDSKIMIQANDGGANVSIDGGDNWTSQANQPTAELYQVATDDQFPYRLYGAQQDNTTVIVPSLSLGDGQDYRIGPGCETGPIIPKLNDPKMVWGACKGQFSRLDLRTNVNEERLWIGSESLYGSDPKDLRYRFQRVAPLEISPVEPNTVYYGSQFVHRSRDGGTSWEVISPDLTARPADKQYASGSPITIDATGEEVYSVVYAIRESKLKPGVIWAGSNDGLIHVTQDAGASWQNVTPEGLPPGGRVQNIEPGVREPGTAYAAIYRYLMGDFSPYIYRTQDYGKSWTRLTNGRNGIASDEPTRVVREDPERPGLLYAGTEFGLYVSFNNGAKWQNLQLNLPATPVTDLRLAHGDMVLSTQGRGFYVLDNLSVLRQLPQANPDATRLYKPATAIRVNASGDKGADPSEGPEYILPGAQIDYFLASGTATPVTLAIRDSAGQVVRRFTSEGPAPSAAGGGGGGDEDDGSRYRPSYPAKLDAAPGMHRFIWDLRFAEEPVGAAPRRGPQGPLVPPGSYTVELTAGGATSRQPLEIVEDPRVLASGITNADLTALYDHNMRVMKLVADTNMAVSRVTQAQAALATAPDPARERALKPIADRLITPKIRYSKPALQTHVAYLYSQTSAADQKLPPDPVARYTELRGKIDEITAQLNQLLGPVTTAELGRFRTGADGARLNVSVTTEDENESDDDN
jgi:photosystem II stability/assembly factor-like uncharacterized protein